jgi:hypothetical protein
MDYFIEQKYVSQIGLRLAGFSKKEDKFNFRCPYCGDSQKNEKKRRGYIYQSDNGFAFHCHNCGTSRSFSNFLKDQDPFLHKQMSVELYKKEARQEPVIKKKEEKILGKLDLPSLDTLPDDNIAKNYVKGRKIPEEFYKEIYYCDDFTKFVNNIIPDKLLYYGKDERVVVPVYDMNKELVGFQGRTLKDHRSRFIQIMIKESSDKIWGLHRFNPINTSYLLEGPFDAMFLPNALDSLGGNLFGVLENSKHDFSKTILIFDNEPRSKETVQKMSKAIKKGMRVFFWPYDIREKDINEWKMNNDKSFLSIINKKNVLNGLSAALKLNEWRKI